MVNGASFPIPVRIGNSEPVPGKVVHVFSIVVEHHGRFKSGRSGEAPVVFIPKLQSQNGRRTPRPIQRDLRIRNHVGAWSPGTTADQRVGQKPNSFGLHLSCDFFQATGSPPEFAGVAGDEPAMVSDDGGSPGCVEGHIYDVLAGTKRFGAVRSEGVDDLCHPFQTELRSEKRDVPAAQLRFDGFFDGNSLFVQNEEASVVPLGVRLGIDGAAGIQAFFADAFVRIGPFVLEAVAESDNSQTLLFG